MLVTADQKELYDAKTQHYARFGTGVVAAAARRLLPAGGSVLDVGCGSGGLLALLRPQAGRTAGVEPSPTAAAAAAQVSDHVVNSCVEEAGFDPDTFDLLVMADVLEHLVDPDAVLARAVGWVKPGGHVIVSLPNIAHWQARLAVAKGEWRTDDAGTFDASHLHFFAAGNAEQMLRRAGLRDVAIEPVVPRLVNQRRWSSACPCPCAAASRPAGSLWVAGGRTCSAISSSSWASVPAAASRCPSSWVGRLPVAVQPPRLRRIGTSPELSIVIPSHDRPLRLRWLLNALEEQSLPRERFEVIVVHDSATAETDDLLATHSLGARAIRIPPCGPATKRNVGWREASAPTVVFTDDDCRPPAEWLERLRRGRAGPSRGGGAGPRGPGPRRGRDPASRAVGAVPGGGAAVALRADREHALSPRPDRARRWLRRAMPVAAGRGHRPAAARHGAWAPSTSGRPTPSCTTPSSTCSLGERMREAFRWQHLATIVKRYPGMRRHLVLGVFWKAGHPLLLLALAGLVLRRPWLALPYVVHCLGGYGGSCAGAARALSELPARAVLDGVEIAGGDSRLVRARTLWLSGSLAFRAIDLQTAIASNNAWYHSIELAPGVVTPGRVDLRGAAGKVLPDRPARTPRAGRGDLRRLLGLRAGEARRPSVVAIDVEHLEAADWPPIHRARLEQAARDFEIELGKGFAIARRACGRASERVPCNVRDLTAERIGGPVDFAFIGALLLHLRDPVGALEAVRGTLRRRTESCGCSSRSTCG